MYSGYYICNYMFSDLFIFDTVQLQIIGKPEYYHTVLCKQKVWWWTIAFIMANLLSLPFHVRVLIVRDLDLSDYHLLKCRLNTMI